MTESISHLPLRSPFEIPLEDIEALCESEGFRVLRGYLAEKGSNDFCSVHVYCDAETRDTWVLHRDILHALLMPVVELFKRASALAEAALCKPKIEDLELAFGGEARSVFLWLQCFLGEEGVWCCTRGCPGCIVTAALSTESHIRLVIAASLLSTASIQTPPSSPPTSAPSSPASEIQSSTEAIASASNVTLPPIPYILPALRSALSSDPFWGPDHFPYLLSRASILSAGIHALIAECCELELLASSDKLPVNTAARNGNNKGIVRRALPPAEDRSEEEGPGLRLRKSKLAKRQLRMKEEEKDLMRRCALQCWAAAAIPPKMRREILGKGGKRVRSLTCP
ncbi:hypothetical protein GQ43DRAFT_439825 [Delitschia confertaspora ATCC 74209]|uniref:Uncharacterized protein n=1 Tax=Delitschia confertaspora ATCC 74209 TaxID=1513339 RepID=A0A9P4JNE1_9PLEO|nr:hypothetical protein GQ43DRAFT_439825 [Delitschia confertaspora ATCC 74209]